jgi:hypothetical protein
LTVFGFGGWALLRTFEPLQDFAQVQRITAFELLAIFAAVVSHASAPHRCAIGVWLGVSTLLGTGASSGP